MFPQIRVKVYNSCDHKLPEYKTNGAAAMDVIAATSEIIAPGHKATIGTGLFVEIPEGFKINVIPRSGLAHNNSVTVLNSPGLIDSDYRGEIKIIIINHGNTPFEVIKGDRIAQIEVAQVLRISWDTVELNNLSDTDRGVSGFGSTGRI